MLESDESQLDSYSRSVAKALFRKYPEWRKYAHSEFDETKGSNFLYVQVPAPEGSKFKFLRILTGNEELTIGNHEYHNHFWYEDKEWNCVLARKFIRRILNGKTRFAVCYYDESNSNSHSSWAVEKSEDVFDHISAMEKDGVKYGKKIYLRSWDGMNDEEISRP